MSHWLLLSTQVPRSPQTPELGSVRLLTIMKEAVDQRGQDLVLDQSVNKEEKKEGLEKTDQGGWKMRRSNEGAKNGEEAEGGTGAVAVDGRGGQWERARGWGHALKSPGGCVGSG